MARQNKEQAVTNALREEGLIKQGYVDDQGIGHITLTQGKEALVDVHNFHWLSQWNWYARLSHGHWYASRNILLPNNKRTLIEMHRLIMGEPEGMEIDHKNRKATLDNREENLRVATREQNARNEAVRKTNTSGFKGVSKHQCGKYAAQIRFNGKKLYLGLFNTAVEAAAVWNFAAKRLHGEFAGLNDLSHVTTAQKGNQYGTQEQD